MTREPVAVTGLGVVASGVGGVERLTDTLLASKGLVGESALFSAAGLQIPAAHLFKQQWRIVFQRAEQRLGYQPGPHTALALHAATQALASAGLVTPAKARGGVFVACNKLPLDICDLAQLAPYVTAESARFGAFLGSGVRDPRAFHAWRQDQPANEISAACAMDEVVMTHGDACAAGGIAIGTAYRYIRRGELDIALAGGTEVTSNVVYALFFRLLGALAEGGGMAPERVSRPFDKDRCGFVLGEGSAFLLLDSMSHARRRGAPVLATIEGFAKASEAWRITSSPADGSSYAACMQAALDDARLAPGEIDHINAHGTSTVANDACEAAALERLFGARITGIPVTATKSATGHALAASGALEAVLAVEGLRRQVLLPTLNFQSPDPGAEFLQVVRAPRAFAQRRVMSNSFGFGGENCSLIFGLAA